MSEPNDTYTAPAPRQRLKRVWLALGLTSVVASLIVALIGAVGASIMAALPLPENWEMTSSNQPGLQALGGMHLAFMLAMLNPIAFILVMPVTLIVAALSAGQLSWRGYVRRRTYVWTITALGTVLVGATVAAFGSMQPTIVFIGATLTGLALGALAGFICGHIYYAILRPAEQARGPDVSVF